MAIRDDNSSNIGGLTKTADASSERISEISNVSRTINAMQKQVDQQITEAGINAGDYEHIEEVQNSTIKVMQSLSGTVDEIGRGFLKIASSTAQASKDVITQTGKQLSGEVVGNQKNLIAMALSRTTPLFGYFATKFMETDVYKSATQRMKQNMTEAFGSVSSKFKEGIKSAFGRSKSKTTDKEISSIRTSGEKVPKMASGGYIEKAGLAYLHPAEVVMPIETVLQKVDESIEVTKELASISRMAQLKTLAKMDTYVSSVNHLEKVGIFKGFTRAMNEVYSRHTEPANVRMLRAVLAIQDSIGATIGTWPQIWQKMLVNHPTFRNLVFFTKTMSTVLGSPFKAIYNVFKARGGYKSHLSTEENPMAAAAENIGLVYADGMWRLDNISLYTKATAQAVRDLSAFVTGKKYESLPGISTGQWSVAKVIKRGIETTTKGVFGAGGATVGLIESKLFKRKEFLGPIIKDIGEELVKERGVKKKKGELDLLYSGLKETGFQSLPERLIKQAEKESKMPVHDEDLFNMFDHFSNYSKRFNDNQNIVRKREIKQEQKLIGYTKDIIDINSESLKVQKKMNLRQKLKFVFDKMGGAFSTVKNLITGFLPMALPFILNLFSGGGKGGLVSSIVGKVFTGLTKFIPTFAKSFMSTIGPLFTKWIPKGFTTALSALSKFFSSSVVLKFLGVAGSVGGAAVAGWYAGKALDQWLGISDKFEALLNRYDKQNTVLEKQVNKQRIKDAQEAREGGLGGYKSLETLKLQASLGTYGKRRESDINSINLPAITNAQQKYMAEHIDEYLKYSPTTLKLMRGLWFRHYSSKETGYLFNNDPEKYGMKREEAFLKFVQKRAKPLSDEKQQARFKQYEEKMQRQMGITPTGDTAYDVSMTSKIAEKINNAKEVGVKMYDDASKYANEKINVLKDKTIAQSKDIADIAKNTAAMATVQSKQISAEIREQGKKALDSSKELTKTVHQGLVNTSNSVSTSVQNINTTVHNSADKAVEFSKETMSVLRGEM